MPLFPAFVNLKDKRVLIVGGGPVAERKAKVLLEFTRNITIISPRITGGLLALVSEGLIKHKKRRFIAKDLKGIDVVVVAVDNIELQKRIFKMAEKYGILCNSVDSPRFCNFIFPSVITRGDLVIGISTSGSVPALSKRVREMIEAVLPENIEEALEELKKLRESMPKGKKRQRIIIKRTVELFGDQRK